MGKARQMWSEFCKSTGFEVLEYPTKKQLTCFACAELRGLNIWFQNLVPLYHYLGMICRAWLGKVLGIQLRVEPTFEPTLGEGRSPS